MEAIPFKRSEEELERLLCCLEHKQIIRRGEDSTAFEILVDA